MTIIISYNNNGTINSITGVCKAKDFAQQINTIKEGYT